MVVRALNEVKSRKLRLTTYHTQPLFSLLTDKRLRLVLRMSLGLSQFESLY
jgi:hypothetical protein